MKIAKLKIEKFKNLPDAPGVYYFLGDKKQILYIGKATSLRDRVKSYFTKDLLLTRGPLLEKMIEEAKTVKFVRTDSVLEALMLEVSEIKKHQPRFNSREKDDKSYNYIVITKEEFPRVLIVRGRELDGIENQEARIKNGNIIHNSKFIIQNIFGPYPNSSELKEALKIIRKIFPYRDARCKGQEAKKPCFNYQIGLCPGPCARTVTKAEYKKTVRNLKMFFEGNKPKLIGTLEKEMNALAKKEKFEAAEKVKRTLYALEHIQDISLIKRDMESRIRNHESGFRIEAYDIAHLSGKEVVGVMTVVIDGELDKSQYRKFKLRGGKGNNDVANLREILERRFNHPEWRYPDLVVVDGGKAQINVAKAVQKEIGTRIPVVSVVKDERHRPKGLVGSKKYVVSREREILLANAEAHRFAIKYHRKLRNKGFRI